MSKYKAEQQKNQEQQEKQAPKIVHSSACAGAGDKPAVNPFNGQDQHWKKKKVVSLGSLGQVDKFRAAASHPTGRAYDAAARARKKTKGAKAKRKPRSYSKRAMDMSKCSTDIWGALCPNPGCNQHYIYSANFCRDRLCPICEGRRSRRLFVELLKKIKYCEETYGKSRYVFLTLTIKNVEWKDLKNQGFKVLQKAWNKLYKRFEYDGVITGWARSFECSLGDDGLAHPHIHAILQVPPAYFRAKAGLTYYKHDKITQMWRECLGVGYDPIVDIRAVRDDYRWITNDDTIKADYGMLYEVAKYTVKQEDLQSLDIENFIHYVEAVKGVKLWETGGNLRVSEKTLENFLYDVEEPKHRKGICGKCGKFLQKVHWRWDSAAGNYHGVYCVDDAEGPLYAQRDPPYDDSA